MANLTRSNILAIKKETTSGTLEPLTAGSDFIPLRSGFSITNSLETSSSDELLNDIGKSKDLVVGEAPSGSLPLYVKASGTEGTAPEYGPFIESSLGAAVSELATEHDTVAASTVSVVNLDTGEGASHPKGTALLLKDSVNGYAVRHVKEVNTDALTLNFDLAGAPAAGVNVGKFVNYSPAASGHPTFSVYGWQASTNAAFQHAISGCRANSLSFDFPAKERASLNVEFAGIKYYFDQIEITAANKFLDITDDVGTYQVTLSEAIYNTPLALASEIASKCTAASAGSGADTITCTYSSSTGKFTLTSNGTVFSILWKTGGKGSDNTDTHVGTTIGFDDSADDTGALTYTSDSAISFTPPYTASYDTTDSIIVKSAQFFIGDTDEITCRPSSKVTLSISTPKTDVLSICAANGVDSSLILEREVTITANVLLPQYEAEIFDRAINNTTTQFQFTCGSKDASNNWVPGEVISVWLEAATITATPIQDENGYSIIALEAKGFVSSTEKDIYINFL